MKKAIVEFEGGKFNGMVEVDLTKDPIHEMSWMERIAEAAWEYAKDDDGIGGRFFAADPEYSSLISQPGGSVEATRRGLNKGYKYEITAYRVEGETAFVTCKFVEDVAFKPAAEQITEWRNFHEQQAGDSPQKYAESRKILAVAQKIDGLLAILMGDDLHGKPWRSLEELLENHGHSKDQIAGMTVARRFWAASDIIKNMPRRIETVMLSLKLILGEYFGWPEQDIERMTVEQLWLALDTAIESKSGRIYKIT